MDTIIEGDCDQVIPTIGVVVDGVVTSPPYNLGKNPNHRRKDASDHSFYSSYEDSKTPDDYISLMVSLFKKFQTCVKKEGVVIFNMSYSSKNSSLPYRVVVAVEQETTWKLRDTIGWKKPTAVPFQTSPRNLSRIMELVFVFAQSDTYMTNKPVTKVNERTGQSFYGYMDNFVEAAGSDPGTRDTHKATFSCALVERLLDMFFPKGSIILDPFAGTGTTGVACRKTKRHYILVEIDPSYCVFARNRLCLLTPNKRKISETGEDEEE